MTKLRRRIWKWAAAFVAAVLILLAIGVGLFRLAVPMVPGLRADAEAMAASALGMPVHIGEIDLQWALFGPELVLTNVQLLAPRSREPLVTAARLDIIFGPLDIFQDGLPRPSHVRLHQPTLALERSADGTFFLSGYALPDAGDARGDWRSFLELGLRHGRVTVYDGDLHYRDVARGIEDWTLRLAEVTLASDGENHELEGTLIPPAALGEQIAIEFSAEGPPGTPETWQWAMEFEATALGLEGWYRQLGWSEDGAVQGALDLAGELGGRGLRTMAGKGSLGIEGLAFAEDSLGDGLAGRFETVGMLWNVAREDGAFSVDVKSLVVDGDSRLEGGEFSLRVQDDPPSGEYPLEVRAFRLPLQALAGLTRLLPADSASSLSKVRSAVTRLAPQGQVQALAFGLDAGAEPVRFRVDADFRDIGARHWDELPGFAQLSGNIRGDETAGKLHLDSRDVEIDTGDLFRTPLPVERLEATLSWEAAAGGWRISGSDAAIAIPGATAVADLALELPQEGPARIDLTATVRDVDLAVRSTWLPTGIMSDALVRWLDTGIISGHVPEAHVVLRGPLANFPFRDGSGTFDIRFATRDTVVEYARGWPRVEGLRAKVHFHDAGLDIRVEQASVNGLAVNGGLARFRDLRDGLLEVDAMAAGDMRMAWDFLAASPLKEPLDGLLGALAVSGPMRARVLLDIPLKDVAATAVKVDAELEDVAVHPVSLPWSVEALQGTVTVTENTVSAGKLTGVFTGHPFAATISPGKAAAPEPEGAFLPARIRMSGRTPAAAFDGILPPAWLERLDGEFGWRGELGVGGGEDLRIRLESDLEGISSALPAPLDEPRPVTVDIVLPGEARIEAGFIMEGLGTGRVAFGERGGEWRFDRGRLSLGSTAAPGLPDARGLHVEGEVALLDASAWLGAGFAAKAEAGPPLVQDFAVEAARLAVGGLVLENQALSGTRLENSGWALRLSGPATGRLRIPAPHAAGQSWTVALEQLHLPLDDAGGGKDGNGRSAPDPRKLPDIEIDIRDFRAGPVHLGHVSGSLHRTAIGYTTQNLRAEGPDFTLDLDGRWEVVGDEHYTSITSLLESRDIGNTLAALGYESGIEADSGRIEANLAWHAAPMAMDYGMLEGTVSFRFEDGSLSEVNPGAGRLIGLLSLSALPRRLILDFSDFFSEGLSFDTLKGDFLLTEGNAYTTNVQLEGPSISALLVGRTGLAARDYDQLAIVDPGVSASLPLAGYLAAGPSVGAALLLLSQLLEAPLSDITQVKYRITGSWDDPVIERVQDSNAQKKSDQ